MKTRLGKKLFCFITLLALVTIFCSPVNRLSIFTKEVLLFAYPISSGQTVHTGYIHSVQLTPVEDDYKVVDSRLWLWEERVISHNAGLPVDAPRNGSFFNDKKWMYVRGGRYNWKNVNLRIGNSELGQNWMSIVPYWKKDLYSYWPGQLLRFEVNEVPLIQALLDANTTLYQNGE